MTVSGEESGTDPVALLFSFRGRIGRAQYWIGVAVAIGALVVAGMFAGAAMSTTGGAGGAVFLGIPAVIAFVWIFAAATVKRLRDAGWPVAARIAWGLAPIIWIAATLELIEYIGVIIAIGLLVLFVVPGLLPSKPQA